MRCFRLTVHSRNLGQCYQASQSSYQTPRKLPGSRLILMRKPCLFGPVDNHRYEFHLLYVWVRSANLAVERVRERVRRGGHNVPEYQIRRRYDRSRHNFINLYIPLASSWSAFDNTKRPMVSIADGGLGRQTILFRPDLWAMLSAGIE
jgi:hypothetical protein